MQAMMNNNIFRSQFGGCWTERKDALPDVLARLKRGQISPEEAGQLCFWINYGCIVFENAVPPELIDQINSEVDRAWEESNQAIKVELLGQYHTLNPDLRKQRTKLLDFYVFSDLALQALYTEPIVKFLKMVFEDDPLAFQSLLIDYGTEQLIHLDPTYVVVDSPMEMVACWIALEDVQPGSGELMYYESSHKIPEFIFPENRKSWNPDKDGDELNNQSLHHLYSTCQELGLPLKSFQGRKGDAIIISSGLAYGESEVTQPGLTRKSMGIHYCPNRVTPSYFDFLLEHRNRFKFQGCYYSSGHYKLEQQE